MFDGRTFKAERWAGWLARSGIPWPRLESGELALDDDTFREMARSHPDVALMRELRVSLSQLRLSDLAVGSDGRNRCLLSPFRAKTGRNQPSNSRFIFGPSTWLRGLIKPEPGRAVAYVDWSQQEFGIAASLSGDRAMMDAYRSGDPYLAFGKQAGRIPPDGTKKTHGAEQRAIQGMRSRRPVRHGAGGVGPEDRQTDGLRSGVAPAPSGDLSRILAMVGRGRVPCDALEPTPYRVRLDGPRWPRRQPAFAPEFPMPGQRGRDDAVGVLPGDGEGRQRRGPGS